MQFFPVRIRSRPPDRYIPRHIFHGGERKFSSQDIFSNPRAEYREAHNITGVCVSFVYIFFFDDFECIIQLQESY